MLKARVDLEKYLERQFLKIVTSAEMTKKVCSYAEKKYDIPYVVALDFITMRTQLIEASEFILFCILDSIITTKEANDLKYNLTTVYFTDREIKTYSESKYKVDKIKFPLRFKAIQISENQWSSKIDFKMLMKLRAAQLIAYNENTQRTMERIIQGNKEIFRIKLDKMAVYAIEESYLNGTYIPTPFTFNIPEEDSDFYYDEENCELVIKSLNHFDIVDGYHRYVAACKACDSNKNFNFTMELRIVNIPEYKAQQFIFQEDQKTKMSKADSNTYNHNNLANKIVERINSEPLSNIRGSISRNKGLINYSDISVLIDYYFLTKDREKGKTENQLLISIKNEIIEDFNLLTEYDELYLTEKYSYKQIYIIMHCFEYYSDKSKAKMCKVIENVLKKSENLDPALFYKIAPRRGVSNEIQKILEEVLSDDV